jgi:hypothetical protein
MSLLNKSCYVIFVGCGISGIVIAAPAKDATGKSQNTSEKLPKPLYYDMIDSTDVLAIPSDSSGWDQEDELDNFEEQSEENSRKSKQTPSR